MNRARRSPRILAAVLFGLAGCSSARVDGTVRTPSSPLAGARVLLVCPAPEPARGGAGEITSSGADGRFSIVVEPTSPPSIQMNCELRVFHDGFATRRWPIRDVCTKPDGDVCRAARVDAVLEPL